MHTQALSCYHGSTVSTCSSHPTCSHGSHQGRLGCISAGAWGSTGVSHHDSRSIHTDSKGGEPVQLRLHTRRHSFLALFYFPSTKPALQCGPSESHRPAPYWYNRAPDTCRASFQVARQLAAVLARGRGDGRNRVEARSLSIPSVLTLPLLTIPMDEIPKYKFILGSILKAGPGLTKAFLWILY